MMFLGSGYAERREVLCVAQLLFGVLMTLRPALASAEQAAGAQEVTAESLSEDESDNEAAPEDAENELPEKTLESEKDDFSGGGSGRAPNAASEPRRDPNSATETKTAHKVAIQAGTDAQSDSEAAENETKTASEVPLQAGIDTQSDPEGAGNEHRSGVDRYLSARCKTAFCPSAGWLPKYWLGLEILVELPVGKSFAVGTPSLSAHINNHEFRVELTAGLRVWLFEDLVSFAVYLSTPLSDDPVRVEGVPTTFPGSSIQRTFPGVAIGLFYDLLWIGFDHDELRNGAGSTSSGYTPLYPPNAVISGATVITVAIQPLTAARAMFGLVTDESDE